MKFWRLLIPYVSRIFKHLRLLCLIAVIATQCNIAVQAQKITLNSSGRPAAVVFAEVMRQSGKNFIYDSEILKGVNININVRNQSLKKTLNLMFRDTDIQYKIKGKNILLVRKPRKKKIPDVKFKKPKINDTDTVKVGILRDLIVDGSRNQTLAMNSTHIGSLNVSRENVLKTPVILGEPDVIKTLQFEPGIAGGVEGFAGMYVHGGNSDENLYMLDNIPIYQVNHFGGLFSAFNTDAIKNIDFYKSTFPTKFDGRLSSYMDVYSREGANNKIKGSLRIGLVSGSAHVEGPIWKDHTTFSLSVRRSWYDLFTIPAVAIANAVNEPSEDDFTFGYAFTDLNARITHKFSDKSRLYGMLYYGEDYLKNGTHTSKKSTDYYEKRESRLRWGNIVASAGWIYNFTPDLWGTVCAAFTRYHSTLKSLNESSYLENDDKIDFVSNNMTSKNNISDWILKTDYEWHSSNVNKFNFGASVTFHKYLPSKDSRTLISDNIQSEFQGNYTDYKSREFNIYAEDNLTLFNRLHLNFGLHASLFNITGKTKHGISPRFSFNYTASNNVAVKGGYSRAVQYVHQLSQSVISLPTDQWIPIVGDQKPQTSDNISLGVYWKPMNLLTISVEGYYRWMHDVIDYRDEYYLLPPDAQWNAKLTQGKGTSKGMDFKISKEFGKVKGQVSYSLLWADRQFADKNHGKKFPARFDNRHKINVLLNWKINEKWEIGATWTGMTGNRITLPTQCWQDPRIGPWHYDMMLETEVNNFRLPFYHRLDLSLTRHTRHGYWTFGLYNAYCNMNTIAVVLDYSYNGNIDYYWKPSGEYKSSLKPVFQKFKLLPTIPSVSYTWLF